MPDRARAMPMKIAVGIVIAVAMLWVILLVALLVMRPKGLRVKDAALIMPDLVLLVRDLARDRSIPRRVRARLWILLAWMVSPIDAIPDVIPVIGMADDAILVYLVLRSVTRVAGTETLRRHWRGTPEALAAVERLLRIDDGASARSRRARSEPGDGDRPK